VKVKVLEVKESEIDVAGETSCGMRKAGKGGVVMQELDLQPVVGNKCR